MEGLDDADSSDSEDESEDDSPHASDGSCPSGSRYDGIAGKSNECSSSTLDSLEDTPASSAAEKPLEQPEGTEGEPQGETNSGGQTEIANEENSKMTKPLEEEAQEKNEITQALKEEEQENVPSKAQETNQSESTVSMKYKILFLLFICFYCRFPHCGSSVS